MHGISWLAVLVTFLMITGVLTQSTDPCGKSLRKFAEAMENLPVGGVAAHLDIPGSDAEVVLEQTETNEFFRFEPASRDIVVIKTLDPTVQGSPPILISCEVQDTGVINEILYFMTIKDLNNHAPVFQNEPYTASFTELLPTGIVVYDKVLATDGDPDNHYVLYDILPGPFSDHFSFTAPASGKVMLTKMVDFEQAQTINLTIIAKDDHPVAPGQEPVTLNSTTQISFRIEDGDDQNPVFVQKMYRGHVSENATLGTPVTLNPEISAYDPDVNIDSPIIYSIPTDPDNGDGEYYSVHSATGQLTVTKAVLVRGSIHTFLVKAAKASNADHFAETLVEVTVQATNENAPYFLQAEYKVNNFMENSPLGSHVVTVKAEDKDVVSTACNKTGQGSKLIYSLAEVGEFVIDECTGEITTATLLSYEDIPSFNIRVTVSDGTYSDEATVRVSLFNVNTHNPVFEEAVYEFQGQRQPGYIIGIIKADDKDADSMVTYKLGSFEREFSLDPVSGELSVLAEETDIPNMEYNVVVVAEDDGSPSRVGTSQVFVIFEPMPPAEIPVTQEEGEGNIVIVIVLGVLIGVLLVIIAILCIYIYRNSEKLSNPKTNKSERSSSFQNSFDFNRGVTRSWTDPLKEEVNVKPSTQDRLNYYNSVTAAEAATPGTNEGRTTTAENPFQQQSHNSSVSDLPLPPPPLDEFGSSLYAYHSVSDVDYPTDAKGNVIVTSPELYARPVKRVHQLEGATSTYSTDQPDHPSPQLSDLSFEKLHNAPTKPVHQNNLYDSEVSLDNHQFRRPPPSPHDIPINIHNENSPRSSYSDENYNNDLTSFKVGSTTQLVGSPAKSKSRSGSSILNRGSSNKGSGSLNLYKGTGNISFVDTVDVSPPNSLYSSMTSQRSGLDPALGQEEDGRPGITVYY